MRMRGWIVGCVAGGLTVSLLGGCASMRDYGAVKSANRQLRGEKDQLHRDLLDARTLAGSLNNRVDSCERELKTKAELADLLREENDVLSEMRQTAQAALEGMTERIRFGELAISGPRLPAPLDNALRKFADAHPSSVLYDARRGTVKWSSDLLFAPGRDVVRDSSKETIRRFVEILNSPTGAGFELIVVGHTDNQPIKASRADHPTNWHLSAHRAISVANVLSRYGYPRERTGVMGYGEYRPVADNSTREGAGKNRRVEIYVIPSGAIVPKGRVAGDETVSSPSTALSTP